MIGSDRSNTCLFRLLRGAATRCLLVAAPLAISPAAHAAYNLTFVTDPTVTGVINLLGINDSGTIAGFDNGVTNAGFTLTLPANFTVVNFPGRSLLIRPGVDPGDRHQRRRRPLGLLRGYRRQYHGFTRIGGSFATVDNPLSTVFNQALGINNSNETVGYFAPTATGTPGDIAYSQTGGSFTDINHLLPTNFNSQAVGINSTATPWIVGFYQPDSALATSFGFVDEGGTIQTIDPFGSTFTQALGVNDLGEIVGFYVGADGNQHGYIDNGGVFTSFDPPLLGLDDDQRHQRQGRHCRLLYQPHDRHRRRVRRNARAGAFDLGDDAGRLRGTWLPWLSQGAPGKAGGLRATLMVAVGRATATHLFSRPSCRNEGFP